MAVSGFGKEERYRSDYKKSGKGAKLDSPSCKSGYGIVPNVPSKGEAPKFDSPSKKGDKGRSALSAGRKIGKAPLD